MKEEKVEGEDPVMMDNGGCTFFTVKLGDDNDRRDQALESIPDSFLRFRKRSQIKNRCFSSRLWTSSC
ncbi:hypothetical protein AAFF_G00036220 [Aldrovandia affinis]|uniref:Uncharacterized protein n=1 Tax=Aldrovandia affinis TaxID=143900 RepID=A0AAD7S5I8_9TELE|nr:hypothetical protein AAFF_G00036220 [Aldrovandia affinis]